MMFQFESEINKTTHGFQSSMYDCLLPHFDEPGKTLFFDEVIKEERVEAHEMTRAKVSAAAKRLEKIDPEEREFHSGYHSVKRKLFIRVRPVGEIKEVSQEEPQLDLEA